MAESQVSTVIVVYETDSDELVGTNSMYAFGVSCAATLPASAAAAAILRAILTVVWFLQVDWYQIMTATQSECRESKRE